MQALLDSYEEALEIWTHRMAELRAELTHADWEADLEPCGENERALYEARAAVTSWLQTRELMSRKRRDLVTYLEARAVAAKSWPATAKPKPKPPTSQPGYL